MKRLLPIGLLLVFVCALLLGAAHDHAAGAPNEACKICQVTPQQADLPPPVPTVPAATLAVPSDFAVLSAHSPSGRHLYLSVPKTSPPHSA